jgi:hypothetical protein
MNKISMFYHSLMANRYEKKLRTLTLVALVLSYGGWSTINGNDPRMLFDAILAQMLDTNPDERNYPEIRRYIKETYPMAHFESEGLLYLRWIPKGSDFVIGMEQQQNVNGNEFVVFRNKRIWLKS